MNKKDITITEQYRFITLDCMNYSIGRLAVLISMYIQNKDVMHNKKEFLKKTLILLTNSLGLIVKQDSGFFTHSGYYGNQRFRKHIEFLTEKHSQFLIQKVVKRMLPKSQRHKLPKQLFTNEQNRQQFLQKENRPR